jgi:hypothetical protein
MSARVDAKARGGASPGGRLDATDWLCLTYHVVFFFLLATAGPAGWIAGWRAWAIGHLLSLAVIAWLVVQDPAPRWAAYLRLWYRCLAALALRTARSASSSRPI